MRTISTDPEIIVFWVDPLDEPVDDINVDVEVRIDGRRWSGSFFTLKNVEMIMEHHAQTGECADGLYLWASDMILVKAISDDIILRTVASLREEGEFETVFGSLDD